MLIMIWSKGNGYHSIFKAVSKLKSIKNLNVDGPVWSPPLIWGNSLLIGDWNGKVYCFDTKSFNQKWVLQTNGSIYSSITAVNESLAIICNDNGQMLMIDREGRIVWEKRFSNSLHSNIFIAKNNIICTCYDHNLYKIELNTGEIINRKTFNQTVEEDIYSSPYVDLMNSIIIFGTSNEIVCVDFDTFDVNWIIDTGHIVDATVTADENNVYIGNEGNKFYSIHKVTGVINWITSLRSKVNSSAILINHQVFVGDIDGNLYCMCTSDGEINWINDAFKGFYYCTFTNIGNRLLAFVTSNKFYLVDSIKGDILSMNDVDGTGLHSPPSFSEEYAYVGSHHNMVSIFKLSEA